MPFPQKKQDGVPLRVPLMHPFPKTSSSSGIQLLESAATTKLGPQVEQTPSAEYSTQSEMVEEEATQVLSDR
jgi:hypothetical protein